MRERRGLRKREEDRLDWEVRSLVYGQFVETGLPPTVELIAEGMGVEARQVRAAYERLHERHALFLDSETSEVRMAFPFSGIPTPFRVRAGGALNTGRTAPGTCSASPPRCTRTP